jgi:hypothetical protein
MKKAFMVWALLFEVIAGSRFNVYAQNDTSMQYTNCTIYLNGGEKLSGIDIRNVSGDRIEYARDGSLHDLLMTDIL